MGKYVLLDKLGQGGMGVVYRARQEPLGREVAIKFLTTDPRSHREFAKRFQREIEVCLRLEHPNIIKLFDAGEEDGKCYYVMEYLAGARPLAELIVQDGAQPFERAADIAIQLFTALAHCHEHGILHRDVKPANAMITQSGRAILMDFGLVRDPDATMLTEAGHVVGTPRYLAPEQLRGKDATPATDVWAMGALLYELLTGRQAFSGANMMEITRGILREDPPAPSSLFEKLTPSVDLLIADLLRKDPLERIPDARTAIQRLEEILSETGHPRAVVPRRTGRSRSMSTSASAEPARSSGIAAASGSGSTSTPATPPLRPAYVIGLVLLLAGASAFGLRAWRARSPALVVIDTPASAPPVLQVLDARITAGPGVVRAAVETDVPGALTLCVTSTGSRKESKAGTPATTHRLAVDGLTAGTPYRVEILDGQGRSLRSADVVTPTALQVAERLRRAIEVVEPFSLVRQFTTDYVKSDRRNPTPEQAAAQREMLSRWQRRIDAAMARQATLEAAADFSVVRDAVFGAGGLPPEDQRELLERIHDLEELWDNMREFGVGSPPKIALTSPHYDQVDHTAIPKAKGAAILLETLTGFFPRESTAGDRVEPLHSPEDIRKLRGMTDPRLPSISVEFGGSYLVLPDPLSKSGMPRCTELQLAFNETGPAQGVRVSYSNQPPGTSTTYRAFAWLRPRKEPRHVVYHSLPPGLLARGPIYLKVELIFSWPYAIKKKEGHQLAHVPWIFLAEP